MFRNKKQNNKNKTGRKANDKPKIALVSFW
jgi:hypothetical protein